MRISDWISDVCSSDLLGLLLGAVWSPCFGPTLGAASVLAAQGKDVGQVALVMIAFGIGAALPLLLLGLVSREVMMRWRDRLLRKGQGGTVMLGILLLVIGLLILTRLDKRLETLLLDASTAWLTQLTTRFSASNDACTTTRRHRQRRYS